MFFNGKASGRAWVTFDDESFAAKALEMDQTEMLGRLLEVRPEATSVCGLELLVYEAIIYWIRRRCSADS